MAILPTPTVGMVGVVAEVRSRPRATWQPDEVVYLLGPLEGELGASRFMQLVCGLEAGPVPAVDFTAEQRTATVVRDLVWTGLAAAKDISATADSRSPLPR